MEDEYNSQEDDEVVEQDEYILSLADIYEEVKADSQLRRKYSLV